MAALANRFWESPLPKDQDVDEGEQEEEDSGEEEEEQEEEEDSICEREPEDSVVVSEEDREVPLPEEAEAEEGKPDVKESYKIESRAKPESNEFAEAKEEKDEEEEGNGDGNANHHQGETFTCERLADLEEPEMEEAHLCESEDKNPKEKENNESAELSSSPATFIASEPENDDVEAEAAAAEGSTEEKGTAEERAPTQEGSDPSTGPESKERENGSSKGERERETLPECLLLMMCEPKLSMEVSKETWVCSTDFIRWLPERPAGKSNNAAGGGKRVNVDSSATSSLKPKPKSKPPQPLMQPPRSSCSFPVTGGVAGMSMATMIEQKLVGSKSQNGYEPFVLTRCKSEPMRSSAKLAPEACFWNNRKLEPHPPPAPLGAGVGF
ncbi:hypothetical protein SESBI_12598 [Sesbania bispinosa]|nr:hypothetical protein SESBI_12598 [Sesbania bispinosa]